MASNLSTTIIYPKIFYDNNQSANSWDHVCNFNLWNSKEHVYILINSCKTTPTLLQQKKHTKSKLIKKPYSNRLINSNRRLLPPPKKKNLQQKKILKVNLNNNPLPKNRLLNSRPRPLLKRKKHPLKSGLPLLKGLAFPVRGTSLVPNHQ